MRITPWICCVVLAFSASVASAATYYVSPQGDNGLNGTVPEQAWKSLRHAGDKALPGDTIVLMPGRYRERLNVGRPGLRFVAAGGGESVVSAIQTTHPEATDVELVGLTFTGSLRIKASGWVMLHCRFVSGNSVSFYTGWGVISNALFVGHGSTGLKTYGASVEARFLTLYDYGTAFYVSSGSMTVRDTIVAAAKRVSHVGKKGTFELSDSGFWRSEIPAADAGKGNIEGDPGWDGELRLSPSSVFIDAGGSPANETVVAGLSATADGVPDQGTVDLGFHFPDLPSSPPPTVVPTPTASPTPSPGTPRPSPSPPGGPGDVNYSGFGSLTTGGDPAREFVVTSLSNSGAGSLRQAVDAAGASGGGVITFGVAGDIVLRAGLRVPANTTVDGLTAPPPGITLWGEMVGGGGGVVNIYESNVIVRGLRVRNAGNDGIQIAPKAGDSISDIVVDHCSVTNSSDGGIDITGRNGLRVTDLTLSWNYLAGNGGRCSKGLCGGASLVKYGVSNITFYANFWDKNLRRNPGINGLQIPGGTLADIRYNLVRDPKDSGMQVLSTARANVIGNYFEGQFTPVWFRGGELFASDNVAPKQVLGNVNTPFDVIGEPPLVTRNDVLDRAGTEPRDDIDNFYITEARSYAEVRGNPFSPP